MEDVESALNKQSENWYNKELTDKEKWAVVSAQTSTQSLNEYLSGRNKPSDKEALKSMEEKAKDLDSALAKFETKQDIVTYRGVSSKEFTNVYLGLETKTSGVKSTSYDEKRAKSFAENQGGYIIEYHIKQGRHGADLAGSPSESEREFLIRHNMPQKVLKKKDKKRIVVEVG